MPAYTMLISWTGKVKDLFHASERGCCHASAERHLIRSGRACRAYRHARDSARCDISRRLSHAKPGVTLAIYAHMFHTNDSKAAATINAAFG
jgi:hypothetical protein